MSGHTHREGIGEGEKTRIQRVGRLDKEDTGARLGVDNQTFGLRLEDRVSEEASSIDSRVWKVSAFHTSTSTDASQGTNG